MRKTKAYVWFTCVLLSVGWIGCEQNTLIRDLKYADEFEEVYPPEPVPALTAFADGELITIQANESGQIVANTDTLKWDESPLHEGSLMVVRYQVLIGTEDETFDGDDSSLLSVSTADGEGLDTTLTLNHVTLDDIAMNAGINAGETGTLSWKVRAYCGLDKTLSDVTGYFRVARPASTN